MSGIDAKREGDKVCVTVRVGNKTARFKVTPAYARDLANSLNEAAGASEDPLDRVVSKIIDGRGGSDFLGQVRDILRGKGAA